MFISGYFISAVWTNQQIALGPCLFDTNKYSRSIIINCHTGN